MYICKSEKSATITQLELSDYFSEGRKIVFDMDNERESKKATRILKPKGLIKKRRRNAKKVKPQKQTTMADMFGTKLNKSRKKRSSIKKETKDLSKKIPQIIKKETKSIVKPSSTNQKIEPNPQPEIKKVVQPKLKKKTKSIPSMTKPFVDYDTITKFGQDGDVEITCPFCSDTMFFFYDDLEGKNIRNTRVCSCDAVARISTRQYNKKIFLDLGLKEEHSKLIKSFENDLQDEYGNPIFTFAFQNQI
ncbi:hypothetical protein NEF87_000373 [Candidatus Lokiarchaeum ossiferum]|uniref:Uncharacterized protein n=1 Tax=Candidatus Lokiarchaeum ossiferum TaxID=2951803 RepID=A0ABY6HLA3_9ARCH|nr:hypothetical protein NEF87_000373 [Candidatus Lokiarchaeum sp. B-35]